MAVEDDGKASRVQITGSTPAIKKAIGQLQDVLEGKTETVGLLCEKFKVTRKAGLSLIGPKGSRVRSLQEPQNVFICVKQDMETEEAEGVHSSQGGPAQG